jgi:hypothetical protein
MPKKGSVINILAWDTRVSLVDMRQSKTKMDREPVLLRAESPLTVPNRIL